MFPRLVATSCVWRFVLAGTASLLAKPAAAAGFYFPEIGTPSSLGTGGVASTTNIYGADAAWTNPAGMTALEEDRIFAGLQVVVPEIEFDASIASAGGSDGGNAGEKAAIPSFFFIQHSIHTRGCPTAVTNWQTRGASQPGQLCTGERRRTTRPYSRNPGT